MKPPNQAHLQCLSLESKSTTSPLHYTSTEGEDVYDVEGQGYMTAEVE